MANNVLLGSMLTVAMIATPVLAEDDFDASDMTRASTTAIIGLSNQGDVKLTGSLSYRFDNGQTAMTLLEGTMDNDGKYKDARLQYFHVFNLDNATTPRIATSLDIINNEMFTTAALGSIAMVRTPIDSLTFFVRGGLLAGEYDDDFANQFNVTDTSITGAMAAGYAVWKTGQDGTFLAAYPEYTYLNGDIEINTVKATLMAATPMSADGKRWGQIKFENTSGDIKSPIGKMKMDSETLAWFNYKVFF
ncbi:hypothetical protein RCJ22_06895 [Vibrio sp. FNV 38]|nr:hypothetical protein [Vibrio sp. FNV 38]